MIPASISSAMAEPRQDSRHARDPCHRRRRRPAVSVDQPAGRADFRRDGRRRDRRAGRAAGHHAADSDADRAGAARDHAWLAGVAATDPAHERLSPDHRPAGAGDVLFDLRLELLSAARARLGPDLGIAGRKPRRAVADHHAGRREGRRCRRDRRGADHARDHPDRSAAAAAHADRYRALGADGGGEPDRLAARTRRAGGRGRRRRAAAAAGQISGELDVRRDDRLRPCCTAPA